MQGGLIQTSLPTAMTRGQRSQLAGGTTLILPKCKVYCDGVPARQCILSIQAEKLVVESAAHVDIISIPLHHVKALQVRAASVLHPARRPLTASVTSLPRPRQYSEPNGTPYVVLRAQLDLVGLPSALGASRPEPLRLVSRLSTDRLERSPCRTVPGDDLCLEVSARGRQGARRRLDKDDQAAAAHGRPVWALFVAEAVKVRAPRW